MHRLIREIEYIGHDRTILYYSAPFREHTDIHLEIDSDGRLRTKLNSKRDHFNLPFVNL